MRETSSSGGISKMVRSKLGVKIDFPEEIKVEPFTKVFARKVNEVLPFLKPETARFLMIVDEKQLKRIRCGMMKRLKERGLIPRNLKTKILRKNGVIGLYVYLDGGE